MDECMQHNQMKWHQYYNIISVAMNIPNYLLSFFSSIIWSLDTIPVGQVIQPAKALVPAEATATSCRFLATIFLLADIEWEIFVLDHVRDLAPHREEK